MILLTFLSYLWYPVYSNICANRNICICLFLYEKLQGQISRYSIKVYDMAMRYGYEYKNYWSVENELR